jgi:hypothetical protein
MRLAAIMAVTKNAAPSKASRMRSKLVAPSTNGDTPLPTNGESEVIVAFLNDGVSWGDDEGEELCCLML